MRILHVCYTYLPDAVGGTELYVQALARELGAHGITSSIAAPGSTSAFYQRDGIEVYRFNPTLEGIAAASGIPDIGAANSFAKIIESVDPDILHIHARTSAISELLIDKAKAVGKQVVITYHSPTVTCTRGTMLLYGATPCDGAMEIRRCTECSLNLKGLGIFSKPLAYSPRHLGKWLDQQGLRGGLWLALRMRQIVSDQIKTTERFLQKADLVIAPCIWVADLLKLNGIPRERLRLCRQGLIHRQADPSTERVEEVGISNATRHRQLRLGCFARLDPTKGLDFLIKVLKSIPDAPIELCIYGITQNESRLPSGSLEYLAECDQRVNFLPPLPADKVLEAMAQLDLVVVPSLWLETGPLVVLEAFAAGVPVLGSDRGGIAELVRSGIDGQLLPTGDLKAWSKSLSILAANPEIVIEWRKNVKNPRTMTVVAEEMAQHYASILKP